jgi:hypothetical protein
MAQLTAADKPAVAPTRRERMLAPAVTIGLLSAATVALHVRDPHQSGSWGFCPSAALGFYCPGCGGLRAVNDLTDGNLGAAASSNLMLLLALPLVVALLGRWALDSWTGRVRDHRTGRIMAVTTLYLVALAVFTVARNLPVGSWLAP